MTHRLRNYQTPELTEGQYSSALVVWFEDTMARADRAGRTPRMQRTDMKSIARDWMDYGDASGERFRRTGLLRAMCANFGVRDIQSIPDQHLWLVACFVVGHYKPMWLDVWTRITKAPS